MADWYEKQKATLNIGRALQARGWQLLGFREDTSDPQIDYYCPASWYGVAIHPDYPTAVVCVNVSSSSVKSGRDETRTTQHANLSETVQVLFTWPTFSDTPTGRAWHVEVNGKKVASGTGFAKCAEWGARGEQAAAGVADEIEALVKRATRVAAPQSAEAPHQPPAGQGATTATGGQITVTVAHDGAKEWTYLRLQPKVERWQYDAFAKRFGVRWHRTRRQPVIYRLVGADELARFFGPLAGEDQGAQAELSAQLEPSAQPEPSVQPEPPAQSDPQAQSLEDRAVSIRTCQDTAPATTHLRYLMVRKGSGEMYRDPDSGAVDLHIRDRYVVLVVLRHFAGDLLKKIRSGMGHISTNIYDSLEEADADAPNHLIDAVAAAQPTPAQSNPEAPGNGRTHFYDEFSDADWGGTAKARMAATGRANVLQGLGWTVCVTRHQTHRNYIVDARDPAITGFCTSVPGPDGLYGEYAGQRWKLTRCCTPVEPPRIAPFIPVPAESIPGHEIPAAAVRPAKNGAEQLSLF